MNPASAQSTAPFRALVWGLFVLSGASALAYEVIWTRQLTLVAGASTPAVSAVLAVFMGGLALGAWLFGRIADRSGRLLVWYAALEMGIGLFALVQPFLLEGLGRAYVGLVIRADLGPVALLLTRTSLSALLLLVPTTLMGGTLPILVRFVGRGEAGFGRNLGHLYAMNLAGAVLGCAATGLVLIRFLGMRGSLHLAILVSVAVGAGALALSRFPAGDGAPESPEPRALRAPEPGFRNLVWLVVGLSGFFTMAYEVAWTRMLVFSFGSTVYSFTLILVVFLLGLTLGSVVFARLEGRVEGRVLLGASQLAAAGSALALTPLAVRIPQLIGRFATHLGEGGGARLAATFLCGVLVMILPAALMGIAFPLGMRLLADDPGHRGRSIGSAYWVNTAGAVGGSLLTGWVLIPFLTLKGCLLALAGLQAVLGLALLAPGRARRWALAGAAATALAALAFTRQLPGPTPFDQQGYLQGAPVAVDAARDDVNASVSVVRTASGVRALRINGFEATSSGARAAYMPMMSHLPLLLLGRPGARVLVICFGTGATAGAVLLHPGATVDAVDINRTVLAFAPYFDAVNHGVYRNPRARLILDDGRHFLETTRGTYDVITSEPMPPTHAGVVSLYSREYYALARGRLNEGGLLVQWLPFHLLTLQESRDILRTVQDVFPETTLWLHSGTGLIVARKGRPVDLDWKAAGASFADPALARDLAALHVPSPSALLQLHALGPRSVRAFGRLGTVITDDRPSLEFNAPAPLAEETWGGMFQEQARQLLEIYQLRFQDDAPVTDLPEGERADVRASRVVGNAFLTGNIWRRFNQPARAAEFYSYGLTVAREPGEKAELLFQLAQTSLLRKDLPGAAAFLDRCLALDPSYPQAREVRASLP